MQICYTNSLQLPSLPQSSKSHSERDLDSTVVGWWQECFSQRGIAAQQAMCGLVRYRDTETTLPATCAVSTELHRTSIPVITQPPYSPDLASEWLLALPYSENGPQGDAFCKHGWHQIECDGRTPEDCIRSLPVVLPTMAGWMGQVCVCVCACMQGSYFEGDLLYVLPLQWCTTFPGIFWLPLVKCLCWVGSCANLLEVFRQVLPHAWLCSADMTLSRKIIIVSADSRGGKL